mmetsp:Transcript_27248/g.42592  ORF Transcript_27248/g.42592 Transcript_27248/m.42592 type:complete len:207 (-) Transcript_27248:508-1128(-)
MMMSLASADREFGTLGLSSVLQTFQKIVTGSLISAQGGRPVSASRIVQPKLQTSALRPTPWPLMTSGAIQCTVPTTELLLTDLALLAVPCFSTERVSNTKLAPKSASLAICRRFQLLPSVVSPILSSVSIAPGNNRQFAPLISLCNIPLLCRYSNPNNSWLMYIAPSGSGIPPRFLAIPLSEPPSAYSIIIYMVEFVLSVPRSTVT